MTAPDFVPAVRLAAEALMILGSGPPADVIDGLVATPAYPSVVTVVGDEPANWPAALHALNDSLPACRGVRLAISGAAAGALSPAAELATMISGPVQASPGPVLTLPGGRLFAPAGWCWSAPGRTAFTTPSGRTLPAPPWERELDRFVGPGSPPGLRVLPTPSGLWITHADAPAPGLDDPVFGRTEEEGTALVVVGTSEGPPPDRRAVARLAADAADLEVPARFITYGGQELDPAQLATEPAGDAGLDTSSPWWVTKGLVHEIEVGYDDCSACFVLGGVSLTPGALGERVAADPARRGRPVLLLCGVEPPGWVVQTVADQIHVAVAVRMTTRPGWRVHRYREIDRGSPLPLEAADIATMDDLIRMMSTMPRDWIPRPAPPVVIPVLPGPAITVGSTGDPVRPFTAGGITLSAWELAAAVWPRLRDATAVVVDTDAAGDELQRLATFLGMTVAAPEGRHFTPRGAPAARSSGEPTVPVPAPQTIATGANTPAAPVEILMVGPVALTSLPGARPAAPVHAKPPPLPGSAPGDVAAPASTVVAAPVPATRTAVPEHATRPSPDFPVLPTAASTAEQHQLLRQALDWRYDVYLRQVNRALAQRPALRRDAMAPDSVVPDLVAVTALLNGGEDIFLEALRRNPRDEAGEALVACLCGGLRRLPRQLGVTYASSAAPRGGTDLFRRGNILVDSGILAGATAAPQLGANDVELVIWPATGRRVDGFAGEDARGLVLFPPVTRLVVLDTDGGSPPRVFLAERRAAVSDPVNDDRLLSRLRAARPSTRSSTPATRPRELRPDR